MRTIATILVCLIAFVNVTLAAATGKLVFWDSSSNSQSTNRIKHTTRSVNVGTAVEIPSSFDGKYEAIVHLRSGAVLKHENTLGEIKLSVNAEVLSNVYSSDVNIDSAITKGSQMNAAQHVSIKELTALIKEGAVLKDGKVNAYSVAVDDTAALSELLATTSSLLEGQVLYIASEEATSVSADAQAGHYQRHLSSTTQATKTSAPATGAEFSIYYEGTYLYITPDIFTGLMTALFMFFVVLIGLQCMGDIQGMSSFYDKVPSNGKEA